MTTQPFPTFSTVNFTSGKGVRPVLEEASTFVPFILVDELTVSPAAANADFTVKIPANTLVESLIITTSGGLTLAGGATHIGVGISGTLNLFAENAAATLNEAGEVVYDDICAAPVFRAAETTIRLASTNGSGAAAGTIAGTARIVMSGRRYATIVTPE